MKNNLFKKVLVIFKNKNISFLNLENINKVESFLSFLILKIIMISILLYGSFYLKKENPTNKPFKNFITIKESKI